MQKPEQILPGVFDNPAKGQSWHTAFYYFAEHLRTLTDGRINHKSLYALVGMSGSYFNHNNPTIRKRTAGALSRCIHSRRYIEDMQRRHLQSNLVFRLAAKETEQSLEEASGLSLPELRDYLCGPCWQDVEKGLKNESKGIRPEISLSRASIEMNALFSHAPLLVAAEGDLGERQIVSLLLESYFHLLAFGRLSIDYLEGLFDVTMENGSADKALQDNVMPEAGDTKPGEAACLLKYRDSGETAVDGFWLVRPGTPFLVGRKTTNDLIETNPLVSRMHCSIYWKSGRWFFEDLESRHGSRVLRNGVSIFDSAAGNYDPIVLQLGDVIELAQGTSCYRFCSIGSVGSLPALQQYEGFSA